MAGLLNRALSASDLNGITDEASAVEQLGIRPLLVQGDIRNLKLTLPQDEFIIRLLLNTGITSTKRSSENQNSDFQTTFFRQAVKQRQHNLE